MDGGHRYDGFVGIYDADATPWGELTYWIGARLGTRHCSLCEVTHGLFRRKSEWDRCAAALPVPFTAFHRNDAPAAALAAADRAFPIVLGRSGQRYDVVLDRDHIAACHGSPATLAGLLEAALDRG